MVISISVVACSPSSSIPSNFGRLLLWENRSGLRVPLPSVCWRLCRRSISQLQVPLPRLATEQPPGPGMKGKTEDEAVMSRGLLRRDGGMRDLCLMSLCQSSLGITVLHSLWSSFLSVARRIVSPRQFLLALKPELSACPVSFFMFHIVPSCSSLKYQEGQFATNYHYSLLTPNRVQT